MKTRVATIIAAIATLVSLSVPTLGRGAAKPAPAASEPQTYTITIKNFEFTPRDLAIPAGSKVTWINKDEEPHKLSEVNSAFTSQPLDTDGSFTYEFKAAGKFEYFCTLHPRMTGHVVVEQK